MKNPLPCGCNNKGKPLSTDHFYLIDSCEPAYSTSLYFATNELLPYQSFASNCRVCIFPSEGDPNSFPSKPAELFQSIEESTESGFCCRDFYRKQRDWLKLKQDSENLEMNKYSIFVSSRMLTSTNVCVLFELVPEDSSDLLSFRGCYSVLSDLVTFGMYHRTSTLCLFKTIYNENVELW